MPRYEPVKCFGTREPIFSASEPHGAMAFRSAVLKNAVTLITGGTSVLGRQTAQQFVRLGSHVVICDLPSSPGQEVATDLGDGCVFVPADVKSESDVKEVIAVTEKRFGRLDNVINCASKTISSKTVNFQSKTVHPMDEFHDTLLTNVSGTFNVIRNAVALMQKDKDEVKQKGVIINQASIVGTDGQAGQVAFAASNGAITAMTLPLARDLGPHGIRVVAIALGLFKIPSVTELPQKIQNFYFAETLSPNRFGEPEEFAHLCQSIVENPMINGEVIRIDGGIRLKP